MHPRPLYRSMMRGPSSDRWAKDYEGWQVLTVTLLPAEEKLRVVTAMSLRPARINAFRSIAAGTSACTVWRVRAQRTAASPDGSCQVW